MHQIKRVSRSAIVTRKMCEMRRYRQYEMRGTGLLPAESAEKDGVIKLGDLARTRGTILHATSVLIIEGKQDWRDQLTDLCQVLPPSIQKAQETLIRRALLGWDLIRGNWWREHFDVISTEHAWSWPITPTIHEPLRMDKILRRKSDGLLGIFDYKTMKDVDPNWIERQEASDQTHLYIQALKERSQEWVLGICYDGVVIGSFEKGIQRSPFVTGHERYNTIYPRWQAGSKPISLLTMTDAEWLTWARKHEILNDLYPTTGFLNPPAHLLLQTKRSVGRAEEEFNARVEVIEDIRQTFGEDSDEFDQALGLLEKNGDACYKYGFGYACPYVQQCWQGFPMDEAFEPREDHHAP